MNIYMRKTKLNLYYNTNGGTLDTNPDGVTVGPDGTINFSWADTVVNAVDANNNAAGQINEINIDTKFDLLDNSNTTYMKLSLYGRNGTNYYTTKDGKRFYAVGAVYKASDFADISKNDAAVVLYAEYAKKVKGFDWINQKWYYRKEDGSFTSGWIQTYSDDYSDNYRVVYTPSKAYGWYYLDPGNGNTLATGWKKIGNYWYYFTTSDNVYKDNWDPNKYSTGYMLANDHYTYNGKTYYFDSNGHCTNP